MKENQPVIDPQLQWPNDLLDWVDERTLMSLVFEAVHMAEHESVSSRELLPPGRPRILLSVLLYSYAIGLRASAEITDLIATNSQLSYLAAGITPSESEFRQFRRHHRTTLQCS